MKKFFRDSPPTYEEAVIEMRVIRPLIPVGRRRSLSLSDIRADAVSSASHSGTTAEQSDGPSQNDPTDQSDQTDQSDHVEVAPDEESVATSPTSTTADDQQLLRNENSGDDRG
uniref:Uncharacterized protein n=1 Tax=Plectus sambesii TaxID=2011161 RepID=A0A914V7V3_9BILA